MNLPPRDRYHRPFLPGGHPLRLVAIILVASVVLASAADAGAATPPAPVISAPEAIVIDGLTGAVVFARNADTERYPASTVKVMTALLVLQSHVPMNRVVTVSYLAATYGGSSAGLYSGEQMTVWNLLHAMMMPSGNDAAVALAETVGGSVPQFVARMNVEARVLHLWHTHYASPNGFDTWGQVTTARDLASLTRIAMEQPRFAKIVRTKYWTVRGSSGQILHRWTNLNQLLWASNDVVGVKTGTTSGAGACLVSSARLRGKWVIAVNMGSSEATRFTDGMALLNYGLPLAASLPSAR